MAAWSELARSAGAAGPELNIIAPTIAAHQVNASIWFADNSIHCGNSPRIHCHNPCMKVLHARNNLPMTPENSKNSSSRANSWSAAGMTST
jgi:hypothetical protein